MGLTPEQFAQKVKEFNERAKKKAEKQLKRVCLKAFQNIVQRTPVLTGCARGNWRINFGETPLRAFDSSVKDPSGSKTLSVGSATILSKSTLGLRVNLCNSTPYIVRLERGYSRQAPNGIVHITVEEIAAATGSVIF